MKATLSALAIVALTLGLGGCLLSGDDYVMSYGVDVSTESDLSPDAYTFNVTISGR